MSREVLGRREAARKELLDLGLCNPLLDHRSRTRQIRVLDEVAAEVCRQLVVERRALTFEPLPDDVAQQSAEDVPAGAEPGWAELLAQPEEEGSDGRVATRHRGDRLQTSLTSRRLQSRLLAMHRDARSYIEEQGVNSLFLAIGFLHWYEAPESEEVRSAVRGRAAISDQQRACR